MDLSLENKRAIVCGSTDGIGKEIAIKLSKQNANITLLCLLYTSPSPRDRG